MYPYLDFFNDGDSANNTSDLWSHLGPHVYLNQSPPETSVPLDPVNVNVVNQGYTYSTAPSQTSYIFLANPTTVRDWQSSPRHYVAAYSHPPILAPYPPKYP
nr:hypothetical protein Itr_chr05CG11500 [Ipomoea trifida]